MNKPVIIAHRGASAYAPENTMSSFKKALELGAGGIELDVQLTSDGYLVVAHDEKVDRTSDGTGYIKGMSFEQIRQLDFGSWFGSQFKGERIPLLEQVLELLAGCSILLNVEIKNGPVLYPGIEQKLIDLLRKYDMVARTIISSFNHYSLAEVKRICPEIRIGLLYVAALYEPWEYAKRVDAYAIHPLFYSAVPEIVEGCRQNGIAVNPYTVDQPEFMRKLAAAGVDGIITNVPDVAIKTLKEMGDSNEA